MTPQHHVTPAPAETPRLATSSATRAWLLTAIAASALWLSACSENAGQARAQAGGARKPAVTVIETTRTTVPLTNELPGRTTAYLKAEIRPQISGIIQKRLFKEGGTVKAGEVLYQIDPAAYQADYDSAKASLARAQAVLKSASLTAKRSAELARIEAVSTQSNEDAQAALAEAKANVASARAAVARAKVDLDRTRISAPIAGRIGRSSATRGALVTANQSDALATVQQLDPIYVDLTQSSTELLTLKQQIAQGRLTRADGTVPVTLLFENGSEYAHRGTLAFSEVTVDASTGSVTLRARFPNPDGDLLPGMFVRARTAQGATQAVLVPHAAVSRDARGQAVVMLVDDKNTVQARTVSAERTLGDQWVITDGLSGGERVIIEGLQKVRPGVAVTAERPGASAPASPAPAATAK